MDYDLHTEHFSIFSRREDKFGFNGFPSITKLDDGRLLMSCRGLALHHMCPFGKSVLMYGTPDGKKWGLPQVLRDSHLDDRDCSVLNMGNGKLMAAWYNWTNDMYFKRPFYRMLNDTLGNEDYIFVTTHLRSVDLPTQLEDYGSWVCVSEDNGMTWKEPTRCPVASFHGPMMINDGSVLYIGKDIDGKETGGKNMVYRSTDDGKTWEYISDLPLADGCTYANLVDPQAIQLPSGRLICHIRFQKGQNVPLEKYGVGFSVFQTVSDDNGKTWTTPECLGCTGAPPHIIRHSSGALVCVYGRREKPGLGERAMVSLDDGETWIKELILRDDNVDPDLGFPSSVELDDGSILTVYYQYNVQEKADRYTRDMVNDKGETVPVDIKASVMGTRWSIEDILKKNGR